MPPRDDQVFQLSLTEIAFTIAFILLLLLGYGLVKEQNDRMAVEAQLQKLKSIEQTTEALNAAKRELSASLKYAGASKPDELITKLIAADELRKERDHLRKNVDDLDGKLTALEELRAKLEKVAGAIRGNLTRETVESAIALQQEVHKLVDASRIDSSSQQPSNSAKEEQSREAVSMVRQAILTSSEFRKLLKEQLSKDVAPGQEVQAMRYMVSAVKSYSEIAKTGVTPEQMKKDNSDLRGQIVFLKKRLDARGGRDYPPCWVDEAGNVEFLFSVELRPDLIVLAAAWPSKRDADAQALPGIADALAGPHSNQNFVGRIQGIANWSKIQNPECRHYVQLRSLISDAIQSDRARLLIENYFYKTEARR